ncbi:MAG: hypothetical protein JW884_11710 [Deltaproteobacteria bacterium]|nr:hypothetical protein [Deltaproteobacteria bacterium]
MKIEEKRSSLTVPPDTSWFDREPEQFLRRKEFVAFQEIAEIDLADLISRDRDTVQRAQESLSEKSIIINEIRKLHFGYGFPFLVYTHDLKFGEAIPRHNIEIDKAILAFDMCDSLRRRHAALSHAIIPDAIDDLSKTMDRPLVVKNLGSGVGLDTLNALAKSNGAVAVVLNYDTSRQAVELGERITRHLEQRQAIHSGIVKYKRQSLIESAEAADMIIKIGVICGLQDDVAAVLLTDDFKHLNEGGKLIVSSSNHHMKCTDPLASFLIQHIGTAKDPLAGWGLNFRTEEQLRCLLTQAGFHRIEIYGDNNYPGIDTMPDTIRNGVDTLPSEVMGFPHYGSPLQLPSEEVAQKRISYNWIAVATKG